MKRFMLFFLPCACLLAQGPGSGKTEATVIRGKLMGYSAVSPALQRQIEAKYGKKPDPDPKAKGPNAQVGKHGFAYVSPSAEGKPGKK